MLIDTHCHLDFPEFDHDRDEVIRRAKDNDISHIINIGSSLKGSKRSIELAAKDNSIYATVGIHPHEADSADDYTLNELEGLMSSDKVVAVGEIGLDYYRNFSGHSNQKKLFLTLIKLAKRFDLPIVVHSRQAEEEILEILKEAMPIKAVVHCFSGDEVFLKECLDLGFFISFTCNITYKKSDRLKSLVSLTPVERLFLETDAPFLPPEGFRGKRNEPAYVRYLAQEIASIKGMSVEEVSRITTANAREFFKLK